MRNYGYFEEGRVGNVSDLRLWARILDYCRPHKTGMFFSILLSFLVAFALLSLPRLMQLGIDQYIAATDQEAAIRFAGLDRLALMYVGTVVLAFVAGFASDIEQRIQTKGG